MDFTKVDNSIPSAAAAAAAEGVEGEVAAKKEHNQLSQHLLDTDYFGMRQDQIPSSS